MSYLAEQSTLARISEDDVDTTMTPLEAILSFIIGLAANGATEAVQRGWRRRLDAALEDEKALRKALVSRLPLREEVRAACAELARNRRRLDIGPQEAPIWSLLGDELFQNDLAEWLMAGSIEEGSVVKARLIQSITKVLSRAGASAESIEFLKTGYFEALDRAIFSNPILTNWRHQLSLDYLREQVAFLRQKAEEAAGIYSPEKQKDALDRYCAIALKAWDIIDLSNLPEGDVDIATQTLLLRQLYMPLRLRVEVTTESSGDEDAFAELEERREVRRLREAGRGALEAPASPDREARSPVGERLGAARRLVVLGDPGGGKTTMMRWMATAYLLRYRDDAAYEQLPDAETLPDRRWIPVLIRCRDLGEADLCRSFPDFLTQHLQKSELLPEEANVMKAVVLDRVARGEALLLVDGLDEITSPQVRMMFCQEVERTAARYPEAHIVVTSRIVGYRDMPYRMGIGFEHGVIADLTRDDKDLFARRWVDVTEQHQPAEERATRAQELLDALHASDRIERLTGNPMLLTTLALVKRKVGKLPNRRTKLYAEAVSVLLNWNPRHYETIDEEEAIPQLEFLAYEMCHLGVQRLTEDEVLDLLEMIRQEYPNLRAIKRREPHVFLQLLETRSSILIRSGGQWLRQESKEQPVWEFRHLTFQEYLAARALLDGRYPGRDRTKTLDQQVSPLAGFVKGTGRIVRGEPELEVAESWQEALRLLVADCKDDDVDDVLRAIATPMPGEDAAKTARPRAILAARCLADEPNVSEPIAEELLQGLVRQVSRGDGHVGKSILNVAVTELGKCLWAQRLKRCLIHEYCSQTPDGRTQAGGLWFIVESIADPQDERALEAWFRRIPERLRSGDEMEAVAAALAVTVAAYKGRALVVPGLVDSLLDILPLSRPLCHAGAWALFWLCKGPGIPSPGIVPTWRPQDNEVLSLINAFRNTASEETYTCRWLASTLGTSKDLPALVALIDRLDDPNARIRTAVVKALAELGDPKAVALLKGRLDDPKAYVRRAAVRVFAQRMNEVNQKLLSRNLDAREPWIDPKVPITEERVIEAASRFNIAPEEVRSRYESLPAVLGLKLSWKMQK